ncbi:MAG: hypothetical protein ACLPX7_14685 [Xanthobacteraceae bacterium]
MSERPASDRLIEGSMTPRLYRALLTRGGRIELAILAAVVIVVVAVGSHGYGKWLARGDVLNRNLTIQRLQGEGEKLERTVEAQIVNIAALEAKLKQLQATLDAIMPAEHTYNINPNQSLIVPGGHLTIGLVGSPTNQYVNININGKQQSAAAGTVLNVAPDPATSCAVMIQSFDMFKAVVTASCEAKPK